MPAKRPTRPKQRPRLRTGTLMDATPQAISRHLSDIATEVERIDGEFDVFTANKDGRTPASGGGNATFLRADGKWATPSGGISLPIAESDVTNLVTDLSGKAPTSRLINTTAPLTGGGDLGADRTLAVSTFSAGSAGVVPASGGGSANVLHADATWAPAVSTFGVGFFGDGSDGALNFDGVSTVLGIAPSTGVYTLTRDIFAASIVSSATVITAGYRVFTRGTLSGGIWKNNGAAAVSDAGGIGGVGNFLGAGGNGGNGAVNSGTATNGGASSHCPREFTQGTPAVANHAAGVNGGAGQGGSGGDKSGGGGGQGGNTTWTSSTQACRDILFAIQGHGIGDSAAITAGSGGGGGRGDGFTGIGGGGGGGGGWVVIVARTLTGATVQAKGGAASGGVSGDGGGGGGGGGGVVVIVTDSSTPPTIDVTGGAGGIAAGSGFKGGNGGNGISIVYTTP